jgi:hypothetical protein
MSAEFLNPIFNFWTLIKYHDNLGAVVIRFSGAKRLPDLGIHRPWLLLRMPAPAPWALASILVRLPFCVGRWSTSNTLSFLVFFSFLLLALCMFWRLLHFIVPWDERIGHNVRVGWHWRQAEMGARARHAFPEAPYFVVRGKKKKSSRAGPARFRPTKGAPQKAGRSACTSRFFCIMAQTATNPPISGNSSQVIDKRAI